MDENLFSQNSNKKKPRIFNITDEVFKILCQADKKNLDPNTGLENLVTMYLSLAGPLDWKKIDLERAKAMSRKTLADGPDTTELFN